MSSVSFKQRIFLVLLGLALTVLFLETGLRMGGFVLTLLQERSNRASFTDGEFRILCLGESTTAIGGRGSYPAQLQDILARKKPDVRFHVINSGMISKTSGDIVAHLDKNLEKYKPHLVVGMIGVNDYLEETNQLVIRGRFFFQKFRVYQLYRLLRLHITRKLEERKSEGVKEEWRDAELFVDVDYPGEKEKNVKSNLDSAMILVKQLENEEVSVRNAMIQTKNPLVRKQGEKRLERVLFAKGWGFAQLGRELRIRKEYEKAEKILRTAAAETPNYGVFVELGRVYKEMGNFRAAVSALTSARAYAQEGLTALMELAWCYAELKMDEDLLSLTKEIESLEIKRTNTYGELAEMLMKRNLDRQAEGFLLKGIARDPAAYYLYEQLALIYGRAGNMEKKKEFLKKAATIKKKYTSFPAYTTLNYNKIAEKVFSRGARLICMQYPRRDINTLKEMFLAGPYPVIFVENKKNFEEVLQSAQYSEYFADQFAGDFGHCTPQGNRLIAENLADVILEKILK